MVSMCQKLFNNENIPNNCNRHYGGRLRNSDKIRAVAKKNL